MRNHAMEGLPSPVSIKVHARIYSVLLNLVGTVSEIIPEIEAARPRASGMEALGLLHNGITKATSLLQRCSESSVLYLALTGEDFLSRCKRSRNSFDQCLSQIQSMVPVILAEKISEVNLALRRAAFCLDPSEEKARNVLRELLHRYGSAIDSTEDYALSSIHAVCSLLHISSHAALVIEKRSIKKQLDKVGEADQPKRKILRLFLRLVDRYRKYTTEDQRHNSLTEHEDTSSFESPCSLSYKVDPQANCSYDGAQTNMLNTCVPLPPKEFVCPLSSKLMNDPVVIASGQTYERMCIEKWFDEGRDTCPKTKVKLEDFSLTENSGMRDLILKWCATNSFSTPNARVQEVVEQSWKSCTDSFASLASAMNNINLPSDSSHTSSLGSSQCSDYSCATSVGFHSLPSNSTVENIKRLLKISDACMSMTPLGKLIQLLLRYLKDAHDCHDVVAQMTGCKYLLEHMQTHSNSVSHLKEDAYCLFTLFLNTEVSKQALSILEVLSFHQQCCHRIVASGAVPGILSMLECQVEELLEPALKILSNLSLNSDICSFVTPSDLIPKLLPLFETKKLARYCVTVLKNLCDDGECIAHIAETDGCVASIAKLLESGSHVEQECALFILLSLCSKEVRYCHLIMDDGVISGLFDVCINGNEKGKSMALRLIQILEDK